MCRCSVPSMQPNGPCGVLDTDLRSVARLSPHCLFRASSNVTKGCVASALCRVPFVEHNTALGLLSYAHDRILNRQLSSNPANGWGRSDAEIPGALNRILEGGFPGIPADRRWIQLFRLGVLGITCPVPWPALAGPELIGTVATNVSAAEFPPLPWAEPSSWS